MSLRARRLLAPPSLAVVLLGVLAPAPALAHSYADPALRTVFDGVQPGDLPAGVEVAVRPSVVDELVVSNPTPTPLDVLAVGGEPFLRVSSSGVLANLASPDWYTTGSPEGGPPLPADVVRDRGSGAPRWALVSKEHSWSEFDPRLHPQAVATAQLRAAGRERVLAAWSVPLRYGDRPVRATGHVLFSPIRGGLVVAVAQAPAGLTANALQGELPGLLLSVPAGRQAVVLGRDGSPFLRFSGGAVQANTASASWGDDQRARGRPVPPSGGRPVWVEVSRGLTFSWLDSRLRYPADQPPPIVLSRSQPSVVQTWSVPVLLDGAAGTLTGTVSWVPRATALRQLGVATRPARGRSWWLGTAGGAVLVAAGAMLLVRRRQR